jgi:hypothetical protein
MVGLGKQVLGHPSLWLLRTLSGNVGNAMCPQVLNKPYSDGGYENSSRVFPNGWDNVGVETVRTYYRWHGWFRSFVERAVCVCDTSWCIDRLGSYGTRLQVERSVIRTV